MKIRLKASHTLLIHGPASFNVISGSISTLGKPLRADETIVVRAGRMKVIDSQNESELDVLVGKDGKVDELENSTIPPQWTSFVNEILKKDTGNMRIMVLGGPDTGKNTFITYVSNLLLKENFKAAVIDADMGQGEMGPPTTMSAAILKNPISELLDVSPDSIFFVGSTSPAYLIGRVLNGVERLSGFIRETAGEATLLVNMPGWITGSGATEFILEVASRVKVNHLVALQRESEVEHILGKVPSGIKLSRMQVSPYARMRSREERRFLRETSYRKYFVGSKDIIVRYSEIDFSPLFSSHGRVASPETIREVERMLNSRVLHCEETSNSINALVATFNPACAETIDEEYLQQLDDREQPAKRLPMPRQKELRIIPVYEISNLIVALFGANEMIIGLGILRELDFDGRRARIATIVKTNELSRIEVGKIKVSAQGNEIGYIEIYRVPFNIS